MGDLKRSIFNPKTVVSDSVETKSSTIDSYASPIRGECNEGTIDHYAIQADDPLNSTWKLVRGRLWAKLDTVTFEPYKQSLSSIFTSSVSQPQPKKLPSRLSDAARKRRELNQIQSKHFTPPFPVLKGKYKSFDP